MCVMRLLRLVCLSVCPVVCSGTFPLPRSDAGSARANLNVAAGRAVSATTLLFTTGLQRADATSASGSVIISPGFTIPSICYEEIGRAFGAASVCSGDDRESLEASSVRLRQVCSRESPALSLFGHSRGGSVAVDAALELGPRGVSRLVLLDPVDDAELTTLRKLDGPPRAPLPPCLLISTPWAGASSYYHYNYESACAPPARSAAAFSRALQRRVGAPGLLVEVPSLGHLAMLSHPEALPAIANLCGSAASPALPPPRLALLRAAVRDLMVAWAAGERVDLTSPLFAAIKRLDPAARAFPL